MTTDITIHRTDERQAGCWVWGVHLNGHLIGWINRDRATRELLSGWWFEAESDEKSDPLGPLTNVIFNHGTRADLVKRLQRMASNQAEAITTTLTQLEQS